MRGSEVLGENKVQIPIQRVSEDDPLRIAGSPKEPPQLDGGVRQVVHREGNVLDDDGGSDPPRSTDRGEEPAPHIPEFFELALLGGELHREDFRNLSEELFRQAHLPGERIRIGGSRLDE